MIPEENQILKDWQILGIIILFGIIIRLVCFSGMTAYDEYAYAHISYNIAQGNFLPSEINNFYGFRWLVNLPVVLGYKIFGINLFSTSYFPFLCSIGNIFLAFLIGRHLYNSKAGIVAALFQSVFPVNVIWGTTLYPDEIICFFTNISVLSLFSKKESYWFVSGISLGFAYLTRINALVILSFILIYVVISKRYKSFLLFLLGFIAVFLTETIFYTVSTGIPFFRWDKTLLCLVNNLRRFPAGYEVYPAAMFAGNLYGLSLFGFFYFAFTAAIIYAIVKKQGKEILIPLIWFFTVFFYLEFGSISISQYIKVHKQLRFLSMVTMPAILIISFMLVELKTRFKKISVFVTLFLTITSLIGAAKMSKYRNSEVSDYRNVYELLKSQSDIKKIIVPDRTWELHLNYYFRTPLSERYYLQPEYKKNRLIAPLQEVKNVKGFKKSYVVLDKEQARTKKGEYIIRKGKYLHRLTSGVRIYWVQ